MADTGSTDTFLLFSDVHFNPFADPSLVPALAASDVSAWKDILASSSLTAYSSYGSDSNYVLFESTLDDMAARAGDVATIIYPGDILSHDFPTDYATLTGDTLFRGSVGRTDSAYGDASLLLESIRSRLLVLPEAVELFPGHGPSTTVGREKAENPFFAPK